jgi:cell division protein FtsB
MRHRRDAHAADTAVVPEPTATKVTRPPGVVERARLERRTVAAIAGLLATGWLAVVFAGVVSDASRLAARAADAQAENAALRSRVEAGRAETLIVQSPEFLDQQARAVGMGDADERAFALEAGAPPPPSITPLGTLTDAPEERAPFDAWMELLFGT